MLQPKRSLGQGETAIDFCVTPPGSLPPGKRGVQEVQEVAITQCDPTRVSTPRKER